MGLEAMGWWLARAHAGGFNYFSASTPITDPKNLPYLYHIYYFLRKTNKLFFWQDINHQHLRPSRRFPGFLAELSVARILGLT